MYDACPRTVVFEIVFINYVSFSRYDIFLGVVTVRIGMRPIRFSRFSIIAAVNPQWEFARSDNLHKVLILATPKG